MNSKQLRAITMAAFFAGGLTMTACDTGQRPGEVNTEDSDHVDEGSLNEGYTSEENPYNQDTVNLEKKYYDDAEGAVHAGDGQGGGVERDEVDQKQ